MTQHPPLSLFSNVSRAALVAASKTSSTPSPVRDEHSKYFRAPISRAAIVPSLSVVNFNDFFLISSWAIGSSFRSFFKPTRMIGTFGHRSFASSTHWARLSDETPLQLETQLCSPYALRCQANLEYRPKSLSKVHGLLSKLAALIFRSPPVLLCPTGLIGLIYHPPCSRSRNSRKRWEPVELLETALWRLFRYEPESLGRIRT